MADDTTPRPEGTPDTTAHADGQEGALEQGLTAYAGAVDTTPVQVAKRTGMFGPRQGEDTSGYGPFSYQ